MSYVFCCSLNIDKAIPAFTEPIGIAFFIFQFDDSCLSISFSPKQK